MRLYAAAWRKVQMPNQRREIVATGTADTLQFVSAGTNRALQPVSGAFSHHICHVGEVKWGNACGSSEPTRRLLVRIDGQEASQLAPITHRRCLHTRAGFTLVEVLVALALVAISLTAIGAVVATSSRGTRSLEQHLALVETARIVAATLPKSEQLTADGLSGEILGHRWRVDISPFFGGGIYQIADSPWIPQTVVVRVRSPSGAVYGFETVRLQRRAVQ